jgi:leucyl-tRNA synthetase
MQDIKDIKVLMYCTDGAMSFGLPAEQYAIQTGQRPEDTTSVNIDGGFDKEGNSWYRKQLDKIGFSFD